MIRKLIVMSAVLLCTMAIMPFAPGPGGTNKHFWAKTFDPEKSTKHSKYILSRKTAPRIYLIELDPDFLGEKFTFKGNSTNTFEVLKPTVNVTIHKSDKLDIDKGFTEIIHENGIIQKPTEQTWTAFNEFFTMSFDPKLEVGNYTLKLKWSGRDANEDSNNPDIGFFRAEDKDENNNPKYLVTTHLEPTGARSVFPCWDEPGLKAQFEIIIKHMPNYTAVSNMPVKSREQLPDGKVLTHFERSPNMSPYLPCVAVADYKRIENSYGNITFYSLENALESLRYALEVSEKVIPALESYTGIAFALPKLDQITIPQYAGTAMEHWGLVSYVTHSVTLKNTTLINNILGKDEIVFLVAHELAHQWFGNLVTPVWWDDVWLNEAFAAYFQYKAVDMMYPEWKIMDYFIVETVNEIAFDAEEVSGRPQPVKWMPFNQRSIRMMFRQVTYAKGSAILHMLSHALGEEVFREGVHRYLKAHQFTAAVSNDLWEDLQEAYDESHKDQPLNIKETMEPWIRQTGNPLLTVTRDNDTGVTHVEQSNAKWSTPANRWNVPLNYATKSNPDFSSTTPMMWIKRNDTKVAIPNIQKDDWIILNIQQTAFYQVNYEMENWRRIADYLNSDDYIKIPPINRAQLITDAYKKYRDDYDEFLEIFADITSYLYRETDFIPWVPVKQIILDFNELMRNTPEEEILSKYMLFLVAEVVDRVGFEDRPDDDHSTQRIRTLITPLACLLEHAECRATGKRIFDEFINNPSEDALDARSVDWIFCSGLREANDTVWEQFITSSLPFPSHIRNSRSEFLKCTENIEIRSKYMSRAMNANFTDDPEQLLVLFDSFFSSNKDDVDYGLKYFVDHFDDIEHYFDEKDESIYTWILIGRLASAIKSQDQLKKFKAFLEPRMGELERKYDDRYMGMLLQDVERQVSDIEAQSAIFHKIMDKRLFGPNAIDNEKNSKKS